MRNVEDPGLARTPQFAPDRGGKGRHYPWVLLITLCAMLSAPCELLSKSNSAGT